MTNLVPTGRITFERRSLDVANLPDWSAEIYTQITSKLRVNSVTKIEDCQGDGVAKVDYYLLFIFIYLLLLKGRFRE
jgi:hypothetical protein